MSEIGVDAIVRGLTKAQRHAVRVGIIPMGRDYWPLYNALNRSSLMRGWQLTPLGLAVRRHLQEMEG